MPNSYTRPDGLKTVNGSDSFGRCPQSPQNCVVIAGGAEQCSCPSSAPVTGVLIDGVVPTIDPVSDVNWCSGLFTVNRNRRNSISLGFSFASGFVLRAVEMKLFNCPAWNIAASTINVYRSFTYPSFATSVPIGSANITDNQDCGSLTPLSIPVQPTDGLIFYIEFTFNNEPNIEWAPHIAEIQFSDESPVLTTTSTEGDSETTQATSGTYLMHTSNMTMYIASRCIHSTFKCYVMVSF